jgi:hypothetical protein
MPGRPTTRAGGGPSPFAPDCVSSLGLRPAHPGVHHRVPGAGTPSPSRSAPARSVSKVGGCTRPQRRYGDIPTPSFAESAPCFERGLLTGLRQLHSRRTGAGGPASAVPQPSAENGGTRGPAHRPACAPDRARSHMRRAGFHPVGAPPRQRLHDFGVAPPAVRRRVGADRHAPRAKSGPPHGPRCHERTVPPLLLRKERSVHGALRAWVVSAPTCRRSPLPSRRCRSAAGGRSCSPGPGSFRASARSSRAGGPARTGR